MSNRELGVEVTMVIDNVLSSLEDLLNSVTKLPDGHDIDLTLNDQASPGIDNVSEKIEALAEAEARVDLEANDYISAAVDEVTENLEGLDGTTAEAVLEAVDHVTNITDDVEASLENIDEMAATSEVNVDDNATDILNEIEGQLDELEGRTVEVEVGVTDTSDLDETNNKLKETEGTSGDIVSNILGMIAGYTGLKTISDSFGVDRQLRLANLYGKGTNQTLEEMRKKVSSLTTASIGPEKIAEAMRLMGEGGLSANEQLKLIGPVVDIIKSKGGDLNTVAKYMTDQMNMYGWTAEEAGNKTLYLNNAMLQTNLSSEEYITLLKRMALSGDALNLSLEDKLNIINSLKASGVDYQTILRALRSGFTGFRKDVDPLDGKLTDAERAIKSMGISMVDSNGKVKTQRQLLIEVMDKLSQMPNGYEKTRLATTIFGNTSGAVFAKLSHGPTEYNRKVASMSTETKNSMDKTVGATKDGIKGIKKETKSLEEYIGGWVNEITTHLSGLPGAVKLALSGLIGLGLVRFIPNIGKKIFEKLGINKLGGYIKSGLSKGIDAIKGTELVQKIISKLKKFPTNFWKWFKDLFKKEGGKLVPGGIAGLILDILLIQEVGNITDWLLHDVLKIPKPEGQKKEEEKGQKSLDNIGNMVKDKVSDIKAWLNQNGVNLSEEIYDPNQGKEAAQNWSNLWSNIQSTGSGIINWIQNNWKTGVTGLAVVPRPKWNNLSSGLPTAKANISAGINAIKISIANSKPNVPRPSWNNLSQGLANAKLRIRNGINNLKTWLPTNKPKIPRLGWSTLQTGLKGVTDGIKYRITNLKTFLQNMAPVLKRAGKNAILGLAAGIEKGKPALEAALKGISAYFPQSPPKKGPLRTIWYSGAWADVGAQMAKSLQRGYETTMKTWSSGQEHPSPAKGGKIVIPAPSNWRGSAATNIARQVASYSRIPTKKTAIGMNWNQIKDSFKNLTTNTANLSRTVSASTKSLGASLGSLATPMRTLPGLLNNITKTVKGSSKTYDPIGAYNRTVGSVYVPAKPGARIGTIGGGTFGDTPSTRSTAKTVGNIYGAVKNIAQTLPKGILYGGRSISKTLAPPIPTPAMNAALPIGTLYGYGQTAAKSGVSSTNEGNISVEKQEINVSLYNATIRSEKDIKKLSKSLASQIDQQAISRGVRTVDMMR